MSRTTLGTATLNALDQSTRRAIAFFELQLDDGTERLHSQLGSYTWGGNTWTGVGDLATIEESAEVLDLKPDPLRVGLNGLTPAVLDMIDTDQIYHRVAKMYLGALNDDLELIEDPGLIFSGYAQNARMSIGNPDGDIVLLECENRVQSLRRRRNIVWSNAQLQSEYPGDLGLQFIDQVPDSRVLWRGRNPVRLGGGGATPGPGRNPRTPDPGAAR